MSQGIDVAPLVYLLASVLPALSWAVIPESAAMPFPRHPAWAGAPPPAVHRSIGTPRQQMSTA